MWSMQVHVSVGLLSLYIMRKAHSFDLLHVLQKLSVYQECDESVDTPGGG